MRFIRAHAEAAIRAAERTGIVSPREHSVPELVAEGHSNRGIGERLEFSQRAVRKHVSAIFGKLGLPAGEQSDRRILAVLADLGPDSASEWA